MATKQTKEVSTQLSSESFEALRSEYPVEPIVNRIILPRIGLVSQDKTEGKGKAMKVIAEAGTFFVERQSDETNEEGKRIWKKEDIGIDFEGIILFQRRQLRYYDSATEVYTSSNVYDSDDETVVLFRDKKEYDRGLPNDLKAKEEYRGLSAKGKNISKLEDNRILYVWYKNEVFQVNLRGTSMFAFMSYAKKTLPPSVLTRFSSEQKDSGKVSWNQMTFTPVRPLDDAEASDILEKITEIKNTIKAEKAQYVTDTSKDKELNDLANGR